MVELTEPSFIDRDPAQVTAELIEIYEAMTGKTLQPAQPERIFIDLVAYRESLLRVQIQAAAVKNLVRFSSGQMLDELGVLVGCSRLQEQAARTTMRFILTAALDFDLPIAAGTRRASKDGKYIFATASLLTIPAGQISGDVLAIAEESGIGGNGYLAGEIRGEVDPLPYMASALNISVTVGGADSELDGHYIERIILKPDSYSTAGPEDAYIYWAMTAHQDIVAVSVLSLAAGTANVFPLMSSGLPAAEILDLVGSTLTPRKRRPLTDLVVVAAPTEVQFQIEAAVTLYNWVGDDDAAAIAGITALLNDYAASMRAGLGNDLVEDQIRGVIRGYRGVYKSAITLPAADQVLASNEWLNCTSIAVTIAGRVNG